MIDETIARIEGRIRSSELSDSSREELIQLLASLRSEIGDLAKEDPAQAKNLALFADQSTLAAQGETADLAQSSSGLESSVAEFEAQHPQLVERVNRVCVILSNMGI